MNTEQQIFITARSRLLSRLDTMSNADLIRLYQGLLQAGVEESDALPPLEDMDTVQLDDLIRQSKSALALLEQERARRSNPQNDDLSDETPQKDTILDEAIKSPQIEDLEQIEGIQEGRLNVTEL